MSSIQPLCVKPTIHVLFARAECILLQWFQNIPLLMYQSLWLTVTQQDNIEISHYWQCSHLYRQSAIWNGASAQRICLPYSWDFLDAPISPCFPETHCNNDFSTIIQIRWKFFVVDIQILMQWSLQNYAHGTTAMLLNSVMCEILKWSAWNYSTQQFPQIRNFELCRTYCWWNVPLDLIVVWSPTGLPLLSSTHFMFV